MMPTLNDFSLRICSQSIATLCVRMRRRFIFIISMPRHDYLICELTLNKLEIIPYERKAERALNWIQYKLIERPQIRI